MTDPKDDLKEYMESDRMRTGAPITEIIDTEIRRAYVEGWRRGQEAVWRWADKLQKTEAEAKRKEPML